ncbi:MAG: serine hydrolase [Bacteroidota bacterium]
MAAPIDDDVNIENHFWMRWSVTNQQIPETAIGGLILIDGNKEQVRDYVDAVNRQFNNSVPVFREISAEESILFADETDSTPSGLLKTATAATLETYGYHIGKEILMTGIAGCIIKSSDVIDSPQQKSFEKGLQKSGLVIIATEADASNYQLNPEVIKKPKKQFESYDQSDGLLVQRLTEMENWLIDWLNNDILIIDQNQQESLDFFSERIKSNKWYRKIAEKKNQKSKNLISQKPISNTENKLIPWDKLQFELIRESMVIVNNNQNIPFPDLDVSFLLIGNEETLPLYKSMYRYAAVQFLDWTVFDEEPERVFTEAVSADQLVVYHRNLSDLATIRSMAAQNKKFTILTNNSDDIEKLLSYGTVIYLNDFDSRQQNLAGQILFGGLPAGGYLPFDVNDQIKRGQSIETEPNYRLAYAKPEMQNINADTLQKIDDIISESIQSGAFPGCQIAVVKNNTLIYEKAFGYFTYDSIFPVRTNHLYDLASITKVAGTLQAVMFLQEQGAISLNEKLGTYLPELKGSNKYDLTIRNILLHEAGLRPYLPFWKVTLEKDLLSPYVYQTTADSLTDNKTFGLNYPTPRQKEAVWQEVIDSDLRKLSKNDTAYNYRYSDLGFMFLHMLVERVSQQPLDNFLEQNIYQPLGLSNTLFNPLTRFPREEISPTEYDYYFRNAQIWGSVHDQNAQVLGGVAGHAGLFSNAHDLSKLMQMNLNGGKYGGYRFLHDQTLQYFTTKQKEHNRRGLGWDKPDAYNGNTSKAASEKTYGHTGFTGTAVWVDPEYDLIFVFLSNRVYPSAENKKLMENNIRIRIQDVIYEAIETDL